MKHCKYFLATMDKKVNWRKRTSVVKQVSHHVVVLVTQCEREVNGISVVFQGKVTQPTERRHCTK